MVTSSVPPETHSLSLSLSQSLSISGFGRPTLPSPAQLQTDQLLIDQSEDDGEQCDKILSQEALPNNDSAKSTLHADLWG